MKVLERASGAGPIRLDAEIARTEAARIVATDDPRFAAKIHRLPDGARARKLQAMIANPPLDPASGQGRAAIAWPVDLLREGGRVVGYAMPRLSPGVSLAHAIDPATRARDLPGFNWHYLHVAALEVARIAAALHARGYAIGDLRAAAFLVDDRAHVALTGVDGIQVRDRTTAAVYRCLAPFDEDAAPETEGRDPAEFDRTEAQDRHALARLIHRLLAGRAPIEGMTPGFGIVHPAIEDLFVRAFDAGRASPRARPAAEEWIGALRLAIDDLVPCARELGHFHASRGGCVWCAEAARTGVDVFATPADLAVETSFIAAHVERALAAGDERHALKLWSRRGEPTGEEPGWDARMADLETTLGALDRFAAHLAADPEDDLALVRLWRGPPDLARSGAAHREGVGGETFAQIGARLVAGLAALDRLAETVRRVDEQGGGFFTEAGETAIAEALAEARGLVSSRTLDRHPEAARAAEAERRLARFADIRIALETGDDRRLVEAWDQGRLLATYAPARERNVEIMRTVYRVNALAAFERHYQRGPDDDSALWALWMREPTLAASRLARAPSEALGGIAPIAWAETAERRVAILQGIVQALMRTPPDARRIAELWDDALCRGRQAFRGLQIAIDRALARHDGLARLSAAIAADIDRSIVDVWNEAAYADRPEIAPHRDRIRLAFRRTGLDVPAPLPVPLGAFEARSESVAARWRWPDGVEACAVALRDGRDPETWDDVERPAHRLYVRRRGNDGEAVIPFRGDDPRVAIWPAAWVAGAPVIGPHALRLGRPVRTPLRYFFDGGRALAIDVPAGASLPPLVALGARGRLPIPGDGEALLLGRLGAIASETGGRIALALDPADETDLYVRLYPEDPGALAGLAFDHPPFRESRIDPG